MSTQAINKADLLGRVVTLLLIALSFPAYAQAQSNQRVLSVVVFDDRGVMKGIRLATFKHVATVPTDSAGQCQIPLDEDQQDGSSLELIVVDPPGLAIKTQEPKYISSARAIKLVLQRRPSAPSSDIARRRELEKAELEAAMHRIEKNTQMASENFSEGLSYFKQKKFTDAMEDFKIAAELAPEEPMYKRFVGICFMNLGQLEAAEQALRKARDLSYEREGTVGPLTRDIDENLTELRQHPRNRDQIQ